MIVAAQPNMDVLQGAEIVVAGRFAAMSAPEVGQLICDLGGKLVPSPGPHTRLLVIGEGDPPDAGAAHSLLLAQARRLQAQGSELEIIDEQVFLGRLGLCHGEEGVRRHYTIVQLSRILGVPDNRIRSWLRGGLIEPAKTINRLALFDFHQVAGVRTICELVDAGFSPAKIRQGLARLRRLLPEVESPLSQVSAAEATSQMLVRLASGQLAEPSGQLHLDFDADEIDDATLAFRLPRKSADAWFDEALALEGARKFQEAAAAYREAIALDANDPVLHFNFGNVLYQLGQPAAAAEEFRLAMRIDPSYVEAWNNLGNMHLELGEQEEALHAFRTALRLVPAYADAYYNLAAALSQMGRQEEARKNWQTYLAFDPSSPWAERAKEHLRDAELPTRETPS